MFANFQLRGANAAHRVHGAIQMYRFNLENRPSRQTTHGEGLAMPPLGPGVKLRSPGVPTSLRCPTHKKWASNLDQLVHRIGQHPIRPEEVAMPLTVPPDLSQPVRESQGPPS